MTRYVQLDKATKLSGVDKSIPNFDSKKDVWYYVDSTGYHYGDSLEVLCQSFTNCEMNFRYLAHNEIVVVHIFSDILKDALHNELNVDDFKSDYNAQQLKWLDLVQSKIKEVKAKPFSKGQVYARLPHYCRRIKEWKCLVNSFSIQREESGSFEYVMAEFSGYNEVYEYNATENPADSKYFHAHSFSNVLCNLISNPNFFNVNGYEHQYSEQQITLLKMTKAKLIEK